MEGMESKPMGDQGEWEGEEPDDEGSRGVTRETQRNGRGDDAFAHASGETHATDGFFDLPVNLSRSARFERGFERL